MLYSESRYRPIAGVVKFHFTEKGGVEMETVWYRNCNLSNLYRCPSKCVLMVADVLRILADRPLNWCFSSPVLSSFVGPQTAAVTAVKPFTSSKFSFRRISTRGTSDTFSKCFPQGHVCDSLRLTGGGCLLPHVAVTKLVGEHLISLAGRYLDLERACWGIKPKTR